MAEKKKNNYIVTILLLLVGYYVIKNLLEPKQPVYTGNDGSTPINTGVNEVITINNPVNTATEELIGVVTNPTEVTDFTADQTTTCFTGCPNPQAIAVINGSCEENNLLPFPPACANPFNTQNTGNLGAIGLGNIQQDLTIDTPIENSSLNSGSSGQNVSSGVGCGGNSTQVNDIISNLVEFEQNTLSSEDNNADTNVVSSTGLANNELVTDPITTATQVNQEALGVFDYNSGFANAYDSETIVTTGSQATASTTGLPTRNRRI